MSSDFLINPPNILTLLSILRACKALGFGTVSTIVIDQLTRVWPTGCSSITEERLPYPVHMVQHSRQLDTPQFLRRAFYEIVRLGFDPATQGLSDKDALIALRMQLALQKQWMQFASTPQESNCDLGRSRRAGCSPHKARKEQWISCVLEDSEARSKDPIYALVELGRIDWSQQGYCAPCVASLRETLLAKKMEWWNLLGTYLA